MMAWQHAASFTLEVEVYGGVSDQFELRGFTREGPFVFRFLSTGATNADTFSFTVPDFPIMFSVLRVLIPSNINDAHITVHLGINGTHHALLAAGNLNATVGLTWPHSVRGNILLDRGENKTANSTNPAAGAEASVTVPENEVWIVNNVAVQLVADGNAANRRVALQLGASAANILLPAPADQMASQTIDYTWAEGLNSVSDATGFRMTQALPRQHFINSNDAIATVTANLQAGDNFGFMTVGVQKFSVRVFNE